MLRWRLSAEPTALIARGRPLRAPHAAVGHRRRRPLHTAAEFGSYDVVHMLLQEHGVDTLAPCGRYDNETAVYIARRSGCRTIARLLTHHDRSIRLLPCLQRLAWACATHTRHAQLPLPAPFCATASLQVAQAGAEFLGGCDGRLNVAAVSAPLAATSPCPRLFPFIFPKAVACR